MINGLRHCTQHDELIGLYISVTTGENLLHVHMYKSQTVEMSQKEKMRLWSGIVFHLKLRLQVRTGDVDH